MVAAARAKMPPELGRRVRFLEGDAAALPLERASCDLVVLVNMIPFLDELDRVLAPGGTLLVSFSQGPKTPIWVPAARLRDGLSRRGFARFEELAAGAATCLLARRG